MKMISYLEYLSIPTKIGLVLVGVFLVLQIVGELLEFKGKIVPEFIKIRKYFSRKKQEREMLKQLPDTLANIQNLLNDVKIHYDADNIAKRDKWMGWVNHQAEVYDHCIADLEKKMDKNNEITLSLFIDSKRNSIIDFASKVVDESYPVTHEQFHRILKIYEEYEKVIEENGMTNGEVEIAIRIIRESYEQHMLNHTFIEDIRGYH